MSFLIMWVLIGFVYFLFGIMVLVMVAIEKDEKKRRGEL
jgi:hypothetical protein